MDFRMETLLAHGGSQSALLRDHWKLRHGPTTLVSEKRVKLG